MELSSKPIERGLKFDDSIEFSDPNPGGGWCPSPAQIREWSLLIRLENELRKGITTDVAADGQPEALTGDGQPNWSKIDQRVP